MLPEIVLYKMIVILLVISEVVTIVLGDSAVAALAIIKTIMEK